MHIVQKNNNTKGSNTIKALAEGKRTKVQPADQTKCQQHCTLGFRTRDGMNTALMPSLKMMGKMIQLATYSSITPIQTPLHPASSFAPWAKFYQSHSPHHQLVSNTQFCGATLHPYTTFPARPPNHAAVHPPLPSPCHPCLMCSLSPWSFD